jgi:hypothetical protein
VGEGTGVAVGRAVAVAVGAAVPVAVGRGDGRAGGGAVGAAVGDEMTTGAEVAGAVADWPGAAQADRRSRMSR